MLMQEGQRVKLVGGNMYEFRLGDLGTVMRDQIYGSRLVYVIVDGSHGNALAFFVDDEVVAYKEPVRGAYDFLTLTDALHSAFHGNKLKIAKYEDNMPYNVWLDHLTRTEFIFWMDVARNLLDEGK